jgi:thiopurine S-methyltransferase
VDPDFWHRRWAEGRTGWHREAFNPHLEIHWPRLGLARGTRVFVPLCGKSRDMLWLAGEGYRVLGVEISPIAVQAFFAENSLSPKVELEVAFTRYAVDEIEILCGDLFNLTPDHLAGVGAVYDRASLIALPPPTRKRYAAHLVNLLPGQASVLLITLAYAQNEMEGPPFSVVEAEVRRLYEPRFAITRLATMDVLADSARYQDRGLSRLEEHVFLLRESPEEK